MLIEMTEMAIKLIKLGSLESAVKFYESLAEKPVFNFYIEDILFNFKWP